MLTTKIIFGTSSDCGTCFVRLGRIPNKALVRNRKPSKSDFRTRSKTSLVNYQSYSPAHSLVFKYRRVIASRVFSTYEINESSNMLIFQHLRKIVSREKTKNSVGIGLTHPSLLVARFETAHNRNSTYFIRSVRLQRGKFLEKRLKKLC